MATKWKNRLIFAGFSLLLMIGLSGFLVIQRYANEYSEKSYFESSAFLDEFYSFTTYLAVYELYDIPFNEAKKLISVTEEDISNYRMEMGKEEEKTAYIKEAIKKEKEKKLAENYTQKEAYKTEYHERAEGFSYSFTNSKTGKVYSNLQENEKLTGSEKINPKMMLFHTDYQISNMDYWGIDESEESLGNLIDLEKVGDFEGEIGAAATNTALKEEANAYDRAKRMLLSYSFISLATLVLSIFISIKSKIVQRLIGTEKISGYMPKIPLDIRGLLVLATFVGGVFCIFGFAEELQYAFLYKNLTDSLDSLFLTMLGAFLWGLTIFQGKQLLNDISSLQQIKKQWCKSVCYRAAKKIQKAIAVLKEAFFYQSTGIQCFLLLVFLVLIGFLAYLLAFNSGFFVIYLLLLAFIGIPFMIKLVKRIGYLHKIIAKSEELLKGEAGSDLEIEGSSVFAQLAQNINGMSQVMKNSQHAQVKSERLKTELITNVSHDLRTPLTSIINYTELLKGKNLTEEQRISYVDIIDRKSHRLKMLIDDLFEVSKMVSGNMELKKEKIDLVQLLQQALAEYDESIQASSLQFRIVNKEIFLYAFVDGQKLWRVFDNLIGNIIKYSLEHSRVYIQMEKKEDKGIIIFKNISKYELNDGAEELYERFKRGDASRHTEGSGLGLAIAKSIMDLHNGILEIETDGDLFKVILILQIEI